jgi:hypothetical protein
VVDGVVWEEGNWEPHLAAGEEGVSWGNHRAVVVLEETATDAGGAATEIEAPPASDDAVIVTIPWRRRDANPERKGLVVVDAATGEAVANAMALRVERASGDVVFQPNPGSSVYHVYYMPWQSTGGYYPTVTYPTPAQLRAAANGPGTMAPDPTDSPSRAQQSRQSSFLWSGLVPNPDPEWISRVRNATTGRLPRARTTRIQSVDRFHSFFPMEVAATAGETAAFMVGARDGWRVVPEHRDRPVRMRWLIPRHWAPTAEEPPVETDGGRGEISSVRASPASGSEGAGSADPAFMSQVLRNEAFSFQIALVAGEEPLEDVRVSFQGFPPTWLESLTCFNCGGVDEKGVRFTKVLNVPAGTVQPLWVGLHIPPDQGPGPVEGTVVVSSQDRGSKRVQVRLEVQPGRADDGGAAEPQLQTRLEWLNSTLGNDPDYLIDPYLPVSVDGSRPDSTHDLSILGRRVLLGPQGLPAQIFSSFTPELTRLAQVPEPVLARPLALEVMTPGEHLEVFQTRPYAVSDVARGRSEWTATSTSDYLDMTVEGALEYDGMLDLKITLVALSDAAVDDIGVPVSLRPEAAVYMLGLGRKGGRRPASLDWKWAVENHQEGVWLGNVHKGLQWVLRDENYVRPLNTNFYRNQPLNMPPSWFNGGLGGIQIVEESGPGQSGEEITAVTAYNYSGPRTLLEGDTLHFNLRMLITPFKPVDTRSHFNTRFVHQYVPVDSVVAWGGTVVNIHHANEINPYINYPFYNLDLQSAYIDEAHDKGIKVKLYNTIRELTYKAHELFPLRSLGYEVLNDGDGGGHSWLQEHLEGDYHSAWHAWRVDDAAILDKGTSRWTNYYVEGINWLARNQHIDGLYLDDIAFSRETVKRLVTVLHQNRPQVVIDLHSANQFNARDGFTNSAMLYMEHFPFISRLWFGEYFEYDLDPDYWMTEVSGLPFGLMGEMLQDGGHPYRGMLYGMTARKYGQVDPRPVWSMMDRFGIAESEMLGYWLEDTPVTTGHPQVLATTYRKAGSALLALASWSGEDQTLALTVNWEALGLDPNQVQAFAPEVLGLQQEAAIDLSAVDIPAGQGLFLILQESTP